MLRSLTQVEYDHYRTSFLEKSSHEPLFRFPKELLIEGQPADIWEIAERYHGWLLENGILKLFFWARPGRLMVEKKSKWYLEALKM
jgi:haloalkane dehalogenase